MLDSNEYAKKVLICKELYGVCIQPTDTFKFESTFMQIWNLLEQLNDIESKIPFCSTNQRTEKNFTSLIQFLKTNKCDVKDSIQIEVFDDNFKDCDQNSAQELNYGIKSNQNFSKGDLIFEIPKDLILTLNEASNFPAINNLIRNDKLLSTMPNVALALLILYLKLTLNTNEKSNSKWKPYLDILPNNFHTPLYFSLDEIKLMQPVQCFNNVILHIRNIARQYCYLVNVLDSKKEKEYKFLKTNFSFRNYKWCVSVVSTRQNQIVDDEKRPILAMIPLLDMCDHEDGEFCTDFDDEKLSARCYANCEIKSGDQVKIFYGYRNNQDLLIHNGFVCESNKYNTFKLKVGISLNDKLFNERSNVLANFGLNCNESFDIPSNFSNPSSKILPPGVFVFVYVFLIKSADELDTILQNQLNQKSNSDILESFYMENNLEKNAEIKSFLKMRLSILLRSYEKSLASIKQIDNDINNNLNSDLTANASSPSFRQSNFLFVKRFINSEFNLIKATLENLD